MKQEVLLADIEDLVKNYQFSKSRSLLGEGWTRKLGQIGGGAALCGIICVGCGPGGAGKLMEARPVAGA